MFESFLFSLFLGGGDGVKCFLGLCVGVGFFFCGDGLFLLGLRYLYNIIILWPLFGGLYMSVFYILLSFVICYKCQMMCFNTHYITLFYKITPFALTGLFEVY